MRCCKPRLTRCLTFCLTLSLLCLWCVAAFSLPAEAAASAPLKRRPHVVMFTPRADGFWSLFAQIAQAAARDLDIELEWIPALNDAKKQLNDAMQVLNRSELPDLLLYKNFDGTAVPILKAAEAKKVYSILFEEALTAAESREYGVPREHFKYWLGEFLPDNLEAGFDLLNALAALARKEGRKDANGKIHLLALGGNMDEGSSTERITGLQIALKKHPDIILHEIAAGFWKESVARSKMRRLLPLYPQTHIIWTANDTMPVGAYLAAKDLGLIRPLIGGVGTTPPGAMDVLEGKVDVSVGGNFLIGAFCLVLVRDFFSGKDFASESAVMRLSMFTFYPNNVKNYAEALSGNNWDQVDFRTFSRTLNPTLKKYPFGFQPILKQLSRGYLPNK